MKGHHVLGMGELPLIVYGPTWMTVRERATFFFLLILLNLLLGSPWLQLSWLGTWVHVRVRCEFVSPMWLKVLLIGKSFYQDRCNRTLRL